MLFFVPPSEILLPALEDYRRESGSDCDGSAGLGGFSDLSDWLAEYGSSPPAKRNGGGGSAPRSSLPSNPPESAPSWPAPAGIPHSSPG